VRPFLSVHKYPAVHSVAAEFVAKREEGVKGKSRAE